MAMLFLLDVTREPLDGSHANTVAADARDDTA